MRTPYRLLVKFPTRGRVDRFFEVLDRYVRLAEAPGALRVLVSADSDDATMNTAAVRERLAGYGNVRLCIGANRSKIEAINADMRDADPFDILLLASDDMVPQVAGYDRIIRDRMREHFPNTDGVLWFNDGFQGQELNTLCILGRAYYERFGYIYHPAYKSFWCDNEFTWVGDILGRQRYVDEVIIRHEHPDHLGGAGQDGLYERNAPAWEADKQTYLTRKQRIFDLRGWSVLKWRIRMRIKRALAAG